MSLVYIATLPESMTVADVVSFDVTSASLPRTLLGRRSGLDELIYDAEGGFSDAWKGFSSLTPTDTGFTLVLGRRAFSAAGVAVFFAAGSGGGGSGDATSIQGHVITGDGSDGQTLVLDESGNLLWVNVGADTLAAAEAYTDAAIAGLPTDDSTLDGVTAALTGHADGQVLGFVGGVIKPVAQTGGSGTPGAAPTYKGHCQSVVSAASSSWAGFASYCTFSDDVVDRVTRSGSTLTFAEAGTYFVHFWLGQNVINYTSGSYVALRARSASTTILSWFGYRYAGTSYDWLSPLEMSGLITVTAGQTVSFEIVVENPPPGAGTFNPGTVAGETNLSSAGLSVFRIAELAPPDSGVVVVDSGTSYAILAADNTKYRRITSTSAKTVTVAPESTTALPVDGEWHFDNDAVSGNITFTPGAGVTIKAPVDGTLYVPPGGVVTLKRLAADVFRLVGATVPV